MTLKKKLVVSALALSVATATFAGIPFGNEAGNQGWVKSAFAEGASSNLSFLQERSNELYAKLSDADRQALRDLRTEIITVFTKPVFESSLTPVLSKLDLTDEQQDTLFSLFKDVSSLYYSDDLSNVVAIRSNSVYINLLNSIAQKAQVSDLTVDDVFEFVFGNGDTKPGVEGEMIKLIQGKDLAELLAIYNDSAKREELAKQAFDIVVNQKAGETGYTLSAVLDHYAITSDNLIEAAHNVNAKLSQAKVKAATLALASAYILTGKLTPSPSPSPTPTPAPGDPGNFIPSTSTPAPSKLGTLDVSKLVQISGGVATVKLVDADVIKAMDALIAGSTDKKNLTLTLDLGTVNAAIVEVPISQAIIDAAKARGIANIAVTFNGVTITLPIAQFNGAVTLKTSILNNAPVTALKLASDVYEFNLTVNGQAVTTFKQPITIKLPLKNTDGLDKELLSVSKIVYGSLQFQGGTLDGEFIVEPRDSFSSYAVLENKVTFSDIANVQAWAGRQIQVVAAKGAIEGVGAGKFAPKNNVTRAEFAKMLVRALNLDNQTATSTFGDVKSSDWFAPYVAVAADKGIINGRSALKFDPNATITRAEMATMIARALKSVHDLTDTGTSASALSAFSDASKVSASLKDGVAFAASNNLVIGNAGKFNPNSPATRAEAAVIIYRTLNFK